MCNNELYWDNNRYVLSCFVKNVKTVILLPSAIALSLSCQHAPPKIHITTLSHRQTYVKLSQSTFCKHIYFVCSTLSQIFWVKFSRLWICSQLRSVSADGGKQTSGWGFISLDYANSLSGGALHSKYDRFQNNRYSVSGQKYSIKYCTDIQAHWNATISWLFDSSWFWIILLHLETLSRLSFPLIHKHLNLSRLVIK